MGKKFELRSSVSDTRSALGRQWKFVGGVIGFTAIGLVSFALPAQGEPLKVGIAGSAPFVIQEGGAKPQGISLDIWNAVVEEATLEYQLIPQPSIKASLAAIASGKLDVAIGPISITPERLKAEKVEFTQPYFFEQVGVLLPAETPSLWSRLKPFFRLAALSSVGVLFVCLFIVGNLIWLAERGQNSDQFPRPYLRGVGNGMWFALVTLTTVGYGDRSPITPVGRWIAGVWMLVTLLAVSSITAGLASAFTLSLADISEEQFTKASDLRGASIAVVSETTSTQWGEYYQAKLKQTKTLEEAIALVASGQVEGAIFDRPALKYYLAQHPDLNLRIASFTLATESYGFALSANRKLERQLDVSLLELHQNGRIRDITERWLK